MTGGTIWFCTLLLLSVCGQVHDVGDEDTLSKHNYGFIWRRHHQVWVSVSHSKLVFYYTLPVIRDVPAEETVNCSALKQESVRLRCQGVRPLLIGFLNARMSTMQYLNEQVQYIYDQIHEVKAVSRVERGFWSSMLSEITGLATEDDLNMIKGHLVNIEEGLEVAAQVWRSGTTSFVTAMQLQKSRVDHVMELLEFQRISIIALQQELVTSMRTSNDVATILRRCLDMQMAVMRQTSQLEALRTAMDHLTAGRLEHFVVNHTKLVGALTSLRGYLQHVHPEVIIARMDARYYYRESKVRLFRVGKQVAIVIDVPLALRTVGTEPLTIYKLSTIPLASPTSKSDYTLLTTEVSAIAYSKNVQYFVEFKNTQDIPIGTVLDLEQSQLLLQDRDVSKSCGLMLMEGTLLEIKKACQYHIIKAPLEPQVYKLTSNKYLLSNITSALITCNETVHKESGQKPIELMSTQNIIHLECGCVVQADQFLLIDSSFECAKNLDLNTTGRSFYILNLPYISEFLDETFLNVMPGDFFLNTSIPVILPALAVASKNYKAILGREEQDTFQLESVINVTKHHGQVFTNLAHYLYNVLLKAHQQNEEFDIFSVLDWLLILSIALSALAVFLAVKMSWKVRALTTLLATIGGHGGHAASLPPLLQLTKSATTTTERVWAYHEHVSNVVPVDVSILICLLLALLLIGYFLYVKYKKPAKIRTKLVLEMGSSIQTFSWIIGEFPYNPNQYRFSVSKGNFVGRYVGFCYGGFLKWTGGLQVTDIPLGRVLPLKQDIWIKPWQAAAIARMVANDSYYVLLIVMTEELSISEIVVLRDEAPVTARRTLSLEDIRHLYPTLLNLPSAPVN